LRRTRWSRRVTGPDRDRRRTGQTRLHRQLSTSGQAETESGRVIVDELQPVVR